MLVTLAPIVALFVIYMRSIYWWSQKKYPNLVGDENKRKLLEAGSLIAGLFVFIMAWGYLYEAICRA